MKLDRSLFARLLKCERGTTAIEYGLIGAMVSISMATILTNTTTSLNEMFLSVVNAFPK